MSRRDGSQEPARSLFEQKRLSRARFLRLLGAGAGLSLVPGSLAGLGGVRVAGAQTSGVPTILAGDTYPVGIWWPPPPNQTTTQRYQEIAAAGFNFVIGGNGVTNDTYNPTALKAAGANNLRYVLRDSKLGSYIHNYASYSDPEAKVRTRIDELLQRYGGYQALAGLYLYDEPSTDLFGILGYARDYLQTKNSKQLPWVNLYGYTTDSNLTGVSNYEEYLRLYLDQVKPPFVSFDHYPLVSEIGSTARHFENWALIRKHSLQAGIPSWGFIQSVDFKWTDNRYLPRRRPNEAELFWQVNVSLAYGAKGLQYFTYWTPNDSTTVEFGQALLTDRGKRTPLYDYAKRVNSYLKVVGKALLPLTSESVVHANEDPLPLGARAFPENGDGYVKSVSGSPVILGSFSNPTGGTERYLLVANRSFSDQAILTKLTLDGSVSKVSELDSSTGTSTEVTLKEPEHYFELTKENGKAIDPGRARLYLLQKTS